MPTPSRRPARPLAWMIVGAACLVVGTLIVTGVSAVLGVHPPTATRVAAAPIAQAKVATKVAPAASCTVRFTGDGITQAAERQRIGELYAGLPIPERSGEVFTGWYRTAADAASVNRLARVNGAQVVACASGSETLYGGWMTSAAFAAEKVGVPILMYHQLTQNPAGQGGPLTANYDYLGAFEENIAYLSQKRFYLPTWDELTAFIDGRLYLPHRSAIVTDDDAAPSWETLGVPIVTKYRMLTTSFVITKYRHAPSPSVYVIQRSHTNDMHSEAVDGKSRMLDATLPQVVADLNTSVRVLGGAREVFAYPLGDFDATAEEGLHEAGFEMAVTTQPGFVQPGAKKLELPRMRMSYGMTQQQFIDIVG
jgi:hypothetical protein